MLSGVLAYRTKASYSFFADVAFDAINTFDHDINAQIKLLARDKQRILDVPLDEELVSECRFGQIRELSHKRDALAASAPAWFANERLIWEVAHMHLQILDLIWQQE